VTVDTLHLLMALYFIWIIMGPDEKKK